MTLLDHLKRFTPIAALKGNRVHAVALTRPSRTMCGRPTSGWKVSLKRMNCRSCKLEILKCRDAMRGGAKC